MILTMLRILKQKESQGLNATNGTPLCKQLRKVFFCKASQIGRAEIQTRPIISNLTNEALILIIPFFKGNTSGPNVAASLISNHNDRIRVYRHNRCRHPN